MSTHTPSPQNGTSHVAYTGEHPNVARYLQWEQENGFPRRHDWQFLTKPEEHRPSN